MTPEADTVLDLEARRRIVAFVQENPGIHLRAMAEQLRVPVSTLEYHCYQLVRHGRLSSRDDGGFKAFYPSEGMDRRDKDILYVVRHDVPRRICTHLVLHPGANPKDLKAVVGLSGPTLSFHIAKLRRSGLVREEPDGRTKRLFLTDAERVASLLVTYRRSFVDDAVDRFAETWLSLRPPGSGKEERPRTEETSVGGDGDARPEATLQQRPAGGPPAGPPSAGDGPGTAGGPLDAVPAPARPPRAFDDD